MVARITMPFSVATALRYNEEKLQQGKAELLGVSGYLLDAHELTYAQKLQGLESRNQLNTRAKTNTLHISLNFGPRENLSNERLVQIATAYLEKIGFSTQPYLVYRHLDSG